MKLRRLVETYGAHAIATGSIALTPELAAELDVFEQFLNECGYPDIPSAEWLPDQARKLLGEK